MARNLEVGKVPVSNSSAGRLSPVVDMPSAGLLSGAISGFANEVKDIAEDIHRTEVKHDQIKVIKAETGILASTDAEVAKLDPLSKDYLKQVEEIHNRAKASAQEGADISTREGKEELDARLSRIAVSGQIVAQKTQRNSVEQEALRTVDQSSNETLAKIRRDPSAAATYSAGFQADYAKLTEGINPDLKRKLDDKMKDSVLTAQVLGYADKGQFAVAKKLLDDNMGTLNPAQEQKARYEMRAIEEKMRADSSRAASNVAADVMVKIERWKYDPDQTAPPPFTRADIDKMRGQFGNNPSAFVSISTALDSAMYGRERAQVATREALQNAETHSLRTQEQADLAFNNQYGLAGKKPAEILTPEMTTNAGIFAREQGFVPSAYKAQIENAGKMGGSGGNTPADQERLASATAAFDRINELAPQTKWGFADDKGSRVQLTSTMAKDEGISVAEASRRVLAMAPKDETDIASRGSAFNDAFKQAHGTGVGQTSVKWTNEQVLSNFSYTGQSVIGALVPGASRPPTVAPEIAADYERKLRENYVKVPNFDVAKKAADDWLKQNYSVTNVGDRNEVTKFAPEKYFDPAVADRVNKYGLASTLIQDEVEQIIQRTKAAGGPVPGRNPYDPKMPGYRLSADDLTAKEAAQFNAAGPSADGKSVRTPVTWALQYLDQAGMSYVTVGRYRLPSAQEIIDTNSRFIINEAGDKGEITQAKEAADARRRITGDKQKAPPLTLPTLPNSGPMPSPVAPSLEQNAAGVGALPGRKVDLEEVLMKRRMQKSGNIP